MSMILLATMSVNKFIIKKVQIKFINFKLQIESNRWYCVCLINENISNNWKALVGIIFQFTKKEEFKTSSKRKITFKLYRANVSCSRSYITTAKLITSDDYQLLNNSWCNKIHKHKMEIRNNYYKSVTIFVFIVLYFLYMAYLTPMFYCSC